MVPTDFSAVVEGLPLTTMQIEQQNKEIRIAEELITFVINQLDAEKGMKLFSPSVHSVTLYGQMHTWVSGKRLVHKSSKPDFNNFSNLLSTPLKHI